MSTDGVQAKTVSECASAVREASEELWREFEAAAGRQAAERVKAAKGDQDAQALASREATRTASMSRAPLVWEVFDTPGRRWWRGTWRLAPAYPDGRLSRSERELAERQGSLVVEPLTSTEEIAERLEVLRRGTPESV